MAFSSRLATIQQFRVTSYSERILANREWVRLFAVLGAVAVDLTLLIVAALAAAYVRHGNITNGDSGMLLLMMLPPYLFASLTYDGYSLDTLRRAPQSAGRANWRF